MTLATVPDVPFCCCPPWQLRHIDARPTHGAMCFMCGRDVAAPEAARGKRVACIYCGPDNGWCPEVDTPLYEAGAEKPIWT